MDDNKLRKLFEDDSFEVTPEERKLFYDRRIFSYSYYIPERRSGEDRRKARHVKWNNEKKVA